MVTKDNNRDSVYDEIAESWYRLRHWTRFKAELDDLAARWGSGRLLNVGCAHGPDFLPFKHNFELYGLDSSGRMTAMALKYAAKFNMNPHLVIADAVRLPFREQVFDYAVSIAAYHHIRQKQLRIEAFKELKRVLKPGGEAFITVWNRWQREFWNRGSELMVPWKTRDREVLRYYYLFTYHELEITMKQTGFHIIKIFPEYAYRFPLKWFSRNICVLVRKG